MFMDIVQVSPFWSYLRFFKLKRIALIVIIFFICFEAIARLAPIIIGKNVHRPFTVSHSICMEGCDIQGKKVSWITNERGARGSLFHGEKIQIAVFGSSTSANVLITQELTWPEQIKANLDREIHRQRTKRQTL